MVTYLVCSATTIINFLRYLWLIDIKYVRRISYDFFVQRVMVFNLQILKIDTGNIEHKTQKDRHGKHWTQETVNRQLATSIH